MPDTHSLILNRLIDSGHADDPWALIVLAAMEGDADLEAFLDKTRSIDLPERTEASKGPAAEPPGVYVKSIGVEGFRGIWPVPR